MINKKDKLYYARIITCSGIYDVCELAVRTVAKDWFVGVSDRDKRAYLFDYKCIGNIVFQDRTDALKKVKEAEKDKVEVSKEIFYEEY